MCIRDRVNIFPDYVPVSSMTLDFGRMEIMTRDWVVMMEKLLIAAETVTLYSLSLIHISEPTRPY